MWPKSLTLSSTKAITHRHSSDYIIRFSLSLSISHCYTQGIRVRQYQLSHIPQERDFSRRIAPRCKVQTDAQRRVVLSGALSPRFGRFGRRRERERQVKLSVQLSRAVEMGPRCIVAFKSCRGIWSLRARWPPYSVIYRGIHLTTEVYIEISLLYIRICCWLLDIRRKDIVVCVCIVKPRTELYLIIYLFI